MDTTTIKIDGHLRKRALARAQKDQLPLDEVIKILILDYAEGDIVIKNKKTQNGFTEEEENEILQDVSDARKNKNVSSYFDDIEDLIFDLKKSTK